MPLVGLDPDLRRRLIAERRRTGADRYDEVWEGIYMMAPLATDEHQGLVALLVAIFQAAIGWTGLGLVRPGVNVSDRETDWTKNYRCPDIVVFLKDTKARNLETHWLGGPDFLVEVMSRGDRSRKKLPFYARIGVREVLLINRKAWALELYRLKDDELVLVGKATAQNGEELVSEVIPLTFRLQAASPRPQIIVKHTDGSQEWQV